MSVYVTVFSSFRNALWQFFFLNQASSIFALHKELLVFILIIFAFFFPFLLRFVSTPKVLIGGEEVEGTKKT